MAINKVIYGGTTLIDLSGDSLASADQLMQGVTAHDRTGALITGTGTGGGGGSVTQDQDGFIILPPDGGGSPSVGGLVYETGTYTPTEDTVHPTINFTNTHTERPFCVLMFDTSEELLDNNDVYGWYIASWYDVFGVGIKVTENQLNYARAQTIYKTSSYTASANNVSQLSGDDVNVKMGYFIKTTGFSPYTGSTSRYWKTGRTYKWIAVWAPTT